MTPNSHPWRTFDHQLTERIAKNGRSTFGFWQSIAGNGMWVLAAISAFLVWHDDIHLLHAILPPMLAYALTLALQNIIRRERPRTERTSPYHLWYRTFSCPSGHATTMAGWATVLGFAAVDDPTAHGFLILALVLITLLVGFSRIVVGVHYFSDVLLGFIVGTLFGLGYVAVFSF